MELIKYMIQVFKDYYPWSLNYILVYEMPWVLNGKFNFLGGALVFSSGIIKSKLLLWFSCLENYQILAPRCRGEEN